MATSNIVTPSMSGGGTSEINDLTLKSPPVGADEVAIADSEDGFKLKKTPVSNFGVGTDVVSSVFGRTGDVTAENGDYIANQITNVVTGSLPPSATTVQSAITELASRYYIHSYYERQLQNQLNLTPSNNVIVLHEISLTVDVLQNDILEVNTTITCDYTAYNDIGDSFSMFFNIGGNRYAAVPIGNITGGDNNLETAYGNLYTPFLVPDSGSCLIEAQITTRTSNQRAFIGGHSGMLAKIVRS